MNKKFAELQKSSDLSQFLRSFLRSYPKTTPFGRLGRMAIRRPGMAASTAGLGALVGGKSLYNIYRRNAEQIPERNPTNPLGIKDPLNTP